MRLLALLETISLFEAAADRYAQAFANIIEMAKVAGKDYEATAELNEEISWALRTLKKDDKIQWYLRFVKLSLMIRLQRALEAAGTPEATEALQRLQRAYQKQSGQFARKMEIPPGEMETYARQVTSSDFRRRMEHFMSLGLPGIENTVFGWQKPQEIWAAWTPIEQAWQEKASKVLDIDEEATETLIKYPDGSAWVDLRKPYCDEEGKAMGHCGNAASASDRDTVLSYRTIEQTEKGKMWKPRLTFILDNSTGFLGEMKGRANQKPDPKYHNVIIDLLNHERVKGIRGGGYDPKNNFALEDLPQETVDKLAEKKPGLASIKYEYQKRGVTKQLLTRMEEIWDDIGIGGSWSYDKDKKEFDVNAGDFLYGIVTNYAGEEARYPMDILVGKEDGFDMFAGSDWPVEDLWAEIPDELINRIGLWLEANHADAVEEWKEQEDEEFDAGRDSDVWEVLEYADLTDEFRMALERGMETGHRYGAEKAMYEAVEEWANELPNDENFDIRLEPGMRDYDEEQHLRIYEESFVRMMSDYIDGLEQEGDMMEFLKREAGLGNIDQPYMGWGHGEYDEAAAIEDASEQIEEIIL